jgi:hypothetical protein
MTQIKSLRLFISTRTQTHRPLSNQFHHPMTQGIGPNSVPSFALGPGGGLVLHFDPAAAARPIRNSPPVTYSRMQPAEDVCTPGWATDHRHVTEEMRDKVY